jgi:hypothetical protein
MKLELIIQILLTFFCTCCFGQNSNIFSTQVEESEYYIGNIRFNTTSIIIKNICNEDIVFWLSNKNVCNMTAKEKIENYFFTIKGDFSLIQLMTDNIVSLPPQILYVSFFKYLVPNESFSINLLSNSISTEIKRNKIKNKLINKINLVPLSSFNNLINNNLIKRFSYKYDFICLELNYLRD